ncbi:MAG: NAD(P)/FAD-dependent oxidoreductase, partial [Dehalococcoidia bacterium]|nr:NAD(P)/FAD-dependent oxidoreductase [Dehalococcoidia bacterium]
MTTFAIIGANLAGGRAAETLRAEGFDGRIVLVGAEPDRPYERPPLSKDVLAGKKPPSSVFLRPHEFYSEQRIELWLGVRATTVNPREHLAHFDDGRALVYDKLLIATGADPIRLSCPGADLAGIHYLRSLADARALRAAMEKAKRVVVVGGGFIGAEVAATCRQAGLEVTILEAQSAPMSAALGETVGAALARAHERHGVTVRCGELVTAFAGRDGVVTSVRTRAGAEYPADLVVVGVGVRPAV